MKQLCNAFCISATVSQAGETRGASEKDPLLSHLRGMISLRPVKSADAKIVSQRQFFPNCYLYYRVYTAHTHFYNIICLW